jgi:hypothetical protein
MARVQCLVARANAYSATTVLPADVCAATNTCGDEQRQLHAAFQHNDTHMCSKHGSMLRPARALPLQLATYGVALLQVQDCLLLQVGNNMGDAYRSVFPVCSQAWLMWELPPHQPVSPVSNSVWYKFNVGGSLTWNVSSSNG